MGSVTSHAFAICQRERLAIWACWDEVTVEKVVAYDGAWERGWADERKMDRFSKEMKVVAEREKKRT